MVSGMIGYKHAMDIELYGHRFHTIQKTRAEYASVSLIDCIGGSVSLPRSHHGTCIKDWG